MLERSIEQQAARDRSAVALAIGVKSYTYGDLSADIRKCAGWLRTLKLKPGSRAIVQSADLYAYWVLFYALEAIQVVSIGLYTLPELNSSTIAALKAEHVFSDESRPEAVRTTWTRLGNRWFLQFRRFRDTPLPARLRQTDDPICIVLSSGTTGAAKKVLFDRGMLERRRELARRSGAFAKPPGRTLAATPPASVAGLLLGIGSFAGGSALCARSGEQDWADTLNRLAVNVLVLAPIHIEKMLAELPEDFAPSREIAVFVVGGTLPSPLIEDLHGRISSNIIQGYGTTETGGITEGHVSLMTGTEDAAGFVNDWLEISIIDDAGEECARGRPGEVRVRGPTVISGYLEEDEQNRRSFRDGWYYPGDMAVLHEDDVLRVVGRVDDIINLGGLKIMPNLVESALLRANPTLQDVAVFGAQDAPSRLQVWIAYVGPHPPEPATIAATLRDVPTVRTLKLAAIPRNYMGKIERTKLRTDVEATLAT